jgi:hypothetical protein
MEELELEKIPREKIMYVHVQTYDSGIPYIYMAEVIGGGENTIIYKVKVPL